MSHTIREKRALLARVRRIQGQFRAVERALEEERECGEILHLIAAARGATNGLMGEVFEEHLRAHLPSLKGDAAVEDLVGVVRSYLK
ncbi:MAG TPA: metal/formaldehyde-sensitive transcriptional repressor [Candidatus Aquilonibacter sp.]